MNIRYPSSHNRQIPIVDNQNLTLEIKYINNRVGYVGLFDFEPCANLDDTEIILKWTCFSKKLQLTKELKRAVINFLHEHHGKHNWFFDCYSFANLVKDVPFHEAGHSLKFWDTFRLSGRLPVGSVVFLNSDRNHFRHAAIYIGLGIYISVWGSRGDLEISTLSNMKRKWEATKAVLAKPK
ncbi:MAG: hypothetical protein ACI9BF_000310 [Candidatus Paceibacteria bacterium]|jgi:hypothetical protein